MSLFVEKTTSMTFSKLMKKKSDFLRVLEEEIHENGPDKNQRSLEVRVLQGDHDPVIVDNMVKDYLNKKNIMLYTSAPYIHQQNLAETYVQSIKYGLRTNMFYNNTPKYYWCYAVEYCYIYNRMPRYDRNITRYEEFIGDKPDMSMYVPFYAKCVTHITKEICEKDGLVFATKAVSCRMLGYADADPIHKMHNTCICIMHLLLCIICIYNA
jgi:hypothetical protein